MSNPINIGVLASGGGSNLQAIIDGCEAGSINGTVRVIVSDVPDAGCLDRARKHGAAAIHVPIAKTGTDQWVVDNQTVVEALRKHDVDLLVMAGYMRKITLEVLEAFPGAVMNIHPALLPSFPGTHGQRDAAAYGVKLAGATVHFADEEFDRGPIIIQGAVPCLGTDTEDTLRERILSVEHQIYPQAVRWFAEGRLCLRDRTVRLDGEPICTARELIWPPIDS